MSKLVFVEDEITFDQSHSTDTRSG